MKRFAKIQEGNKLRRDSQDPSRELVHELDYLGGSAMDHFEPAKGLPHEMVHGLKGLIALLAVSSQSRGSL